MSILDAPLALAGRFHASRGRGWNTWDTRSVLRHVLLPEGLGVSLGFAAPDRLLWVEDACFGCTELARTAGTQLTSTGRQLNVSNTLEVRPGPRSYDGSYTQLEVDLRGARFRVETAAEGDRWIALITPLQDEPWPRALTVHARPLWNSPCTVRRGGDRRLLADLPDRELAICADGEPLEDPNLPTPSPYLALRLDRPVAVSAGEPVAVAEAQQRIHAARVDLDRLHAHHGPLAEAHQAMQACIAWNVIYEPRYRRVICPVARDWNCKRGGYVLFCWDSFFTAWMITLDDPALGYACAIETFREMVDESFVPNVAQATGRVSRDRSQPPVGGLCLLGMYRLHPDPVAIRALWPALLAWNRWWDRARQNERGTLSLGSNPFEPRVGDPAEFIQPDTGDGAAIESGMDNSPMYDDPPFDPATHLMLTEDVGMTSLYAADCRALAELAEQLGEAGDAAELRRRGDRYAAALDRLWCDEQGVYLNRRLDRDAWCDCRSPTSFYPLLAGSVAPGRAHALVENHLMNPAEYFGDWMIPVSPRHEPAFGEQLYQRGRIWPPINFLTYLGLKRYPLDEARGELVRRSLELLLRGWREHGVVAETYSAVDGSGGRGPHTHPLYSWGPLLGFMAMIEAGTVPAPFGAASPAADQRTAES